jgi:hypothetical protein
MGLRTSGYVGIIGVVVFGCAVLILHMVQPRLDPRDEIHGSAAMLAFLPLPLGALCLARAFRQDPRWRPQGSLLLGLAVAAAISLVVFMASLAPVFVRPGPRLLLGLSERVLLATYAAWLVAVDIGIVKHGDR